MRWELPAQLSLPSRASTAASYGNSKANDSLGFFNGLNDVGNVDLAEQPSGKFVLKIDWDVPVLEDVAVHLNQLQDTLKFVGNDLRQPLQDLEAHLARIRPEILEWAAIVRRFSSIQFWSPKVAPFWVHVALAQNGDLEAAHRLSSRIVWNPNQWQREAIRLRARIQGISLSEVQQSSLTQGVSLALGWGKDQVFPVLIQPQSAWLYNSDQTLSSVRPDQLPAPTFWEWFRGEAVRAAGLLLINLP